MAFFIFFLNLWHFSSCAAIFSEWIKTHVSYSQIYLTSWPWSVSTVLPRISHLSGVWIKHCRREDEESAAQGDLLPAVQDVTISQPPDNPGRLNYLLDMCSPLIIEFRWLVWTRYLIFRWPKCREINPAQVPVCLSHWSTKGRAFVCSGLAGELCWCSSAPKKADFGCFSCSSQ